jgi:DnaK suppressor protein
MAARKSEKKKKSAGPKKTAVDRKKTQKAKKPKVLRPKIAKKLEKKIEKKKIRTTEKVPVKSLKVKEPEKVPAVSPEVNESAKKILSAMRQKLIAEISEKPIPETLLATTEIGDIVDQAGDERDRELSLLLTGRDKEKLQAINEALEKITDGSYGICEECGEKIGPGRIKVMPLARYCVSCQSKLEKEISLQRKAEEDQQYRGLTYAPGAEEEEA